MKRAGLVGASVLLALGALVFYWQLRDTREIPQAQSSAARGMQRPKLPTTPKLELVPATGTTPRDAGESLESAKFEEPRVRLERQGPSNDDPGPGPYLQRYQGRSGRLSPHASPDRTAAPVTTTSTSKDPELVVWALSTRVTAGQPGSIRAALRDGSGHALVPERIELTRLTPDNHPLGAPIAMPAQSAGQSEAGQYGYDLPTTAPRDAAGRPAPPEEYRFVVRASGNLQGRPYAREAGGFFYVQQAGAKLDEDSASASLEHGNLELTLQVTTERAGKYFVSAELWGGPQADQPIAFAREQLGQLSPGVRPVTLLFGGQVIRDAGIDGPYTLRNVQLLQVDAIPPHAAEPIASLPPTRAYRSHDFY